MKALIVVALMLSFWQRVQKQQLKPKPDTQQSQPPSPSAPATTPIPSEPEATPQQNSPNAKPSESLCGRLGDALISNWPLVGIGILGILVAWLTLKDIQAQTENTQKAADASVSAARTAKDTLQMAYRPWVNAESAELVGALIFPPHGRFNLQAKLILKNTGTSVAIDGLIMPFAIPDYTSGMKTNIERAWEQTETMRQTKQNNTPWETGFVLNPGSTLEVPVTLGSDEISTEQVQRGDFYILGCILYRDQFGTMHHTQFCFRPTEGVSNRMNIKFRMTPWLQKAD
jgi:hypothetical protein